jgi:hypothetical protein
LEWLHRADPTSGELTLEDLRRDPSVYLLPARDMEADLEKCLKKFCKTIFEEQLDGWYRVKELWPRDRSIDLSGFLYHSDRESITRGEVTDLIQSSDHRFACV